MLITSRNHSLPLLVDQLAQPARKTRDGRSTIPGIIEHYRLSPSPPARQDGSPPPAAVMIVELVGDWGSEFFVAANSGGVGGCGRGVVGRLTRICCASLGFIGLRFEVEGGLKALLLEGLGAGTRVQQGLRS